MSLFRVAKPRCKVRLSADAVLGAGQVTIPLDELVWEDPAGIWTGGPGITVDRAGLYVVQSTLSRQTPGSSMQMQSRHFVNGAFPAEAATITLGANSNTITQPACDWLELDDGDVVTLVGTIGTVAGSTARRIGTFLTVARVGPVRWT